MPKQTVATPLLAAWMLIAVLCAVAEDRSSAGGSAPPSTEPTPRPAFAGELDITVVSLFVTVVDRRGHPVTGLGRDSFEVYEDDQKVELSHFAEVQRLAGSAEADHRLKIEGPAALLNEALGEVGEAAYIALLFDNTSLEHRNRKRILKSMRDFVSDSAARNDRFMVATVGENFRVLEPFTSDLQSISSALDAVARTPALGTEVSGHKRVLHREILATTILQNEADLFGARRGGEEGPSLSSGSMPGGVGDNMAIIRASRLLDRINRLRNSEQRRTLRSLRGIDETVRSLAALPGRKHLVWIGEGLVVKPGLETYQTFYRKFEMWSGELNLQRPDIWSPEGTLTGVFEAVASSAQLAGAALHIIDSGDRDRELASSSFLSVDSTAFLSADEGGNRVGADYDIGESDQLRDGAQFLAAATGGTFLSGSREFRGYFESLRDILGSYYSLGYRLPGESDSLQRPVRIDLDGREHLPLHQERVSRRTPSGLLVDRTMSHLRFGGGDNPLHMSVSFGSTERIDDDRYIQDVGLMFPAAKLQMIEGEDKHSDQLLVIFQSLSDDGFSKPPQLVPLRLAVPTTRLGPHSIVQARVRIVMGSNTRRLAVGVLEESSGVQATTAVDIAAEDS